MRAIVIKKFGGPDGLVYQNLSKPEPKAGYVVIEVKAFGLNHAELHLRRGVVEGAEVSGIECVGLVRTCPGGGFPLGAKVAAFSASRCWAPRLARSWQRCKLPCWQTCGTRGSGMRFSRTRRWQRAWDPSSPTCRRANPVGQSWRGLTIDGQSHRGLRAHRRLRDGSARLEDRLGRLALLAAL